MDIIKKMKQSYSFIYTLLLKTEHNLKLIFYKLNFDKTIYFNFKYFSFYTAIHFPVLIYKRTSLYKMEGTIKMNVPPKWGLIKIGPHNLGTQDFKYSRTMWEVCGTLVVNGMVYIGRGTKISIGKNATLVLGDKFMISGKSDIICQKEITFGNDCLLSWDILIMDTDFHKILNKDGEIVNAPRPINIGNHVWICCRNTILKGVTISDNNIISANSTITKSISESNCAIGGNGKDVVILKRDINWEM